MVWEVREELITIAFCFSPPLFFLGLISLFILLYSPSSIVLVFARYLIKNISQPQSQIRHYNNWQFVPPLTSRKEGHWVDEQIAHNRWKQMEGFFFSLPKKHRIFYAGQVLCGLQPADVTRHRGRKGFGQTRAGSFQGERSFHRGLEARRHTIDLKGAKQREGSLWWVQLLR